MMIEFSRYAGHATLLRYPKCYQICSIDPSFEIHVDKKQRHHVPSFHRLPGILALIKEIPSNSLCSFYSCSATFMLPTSTRFVLFFAEWRLVSKVSALV
jgi:hypothetical protein